MSGLLKPEKRPELFIGLISKIGTDNERISDLISDALKRYGYTPKYIHVTDFLNQFTHIKTEEEPKYRRYHSYIDACNQIRRELNRNDALAFFTVQQIREERLALSEDRDTPVEGTAYIISQFKRPEELAALRAIYGGLFIAISVYETRDERVQNLTQKFAQEAFERSTSETWHREAERLVDRDEEEEHIVHGQKVRHTFPLADYVLKHAGDDATTRQLTRFFDCFFSAPTASPTQNEAGMYLAFAHSLRSADLARQVGAVITDTRGQIISAGANEVPSPAGGEYWHGDDWDRRDVHVGSDSSEDHKRRILQNLLSAAQADGWTPPIALPTNLNSLYELVRAGDPSTGNVSKSEFFDILEFGRSVHAEMSALMAAARLGRSVDGATLYCTTFPCHNCAKHIVASGIRKVVYLEPYPKSLVRELHGDAIHIVDAGSAPAVPEEIKIRPITFEQYCGVAPERYRSLFRKTEKRKGVTGKVKPWSPSGGSPVVAIYRAGYIVVEKAVEAEFLELVSDLVKRS